MPDTLPALNQILCRTLLEKSNAFATFSFNGLSMFVSSMGLSEVGTSFTCMSESLVEELLLELQVLQLLIHVVLSFHSIPLAKIDSHHPPLPGKGFVKDIQRPLDDPLAVTRTTEVHQTDPNPKTSQHHGSN